MDTVRGQWEHLIETLHLSPLIPDVYAPFRETVVEGLKRFLRLLPESRRRQILNEQMDLPPDTGVIERLFLLMRQCPTLHKLGQILSRHPPLPIELRSRLHALESHEPTIDPAQLRGPIDDAMKRAKAFVTAPVHVIAEGSVAVVAACRFQRANDGETFDSAIKILKPDIESRLEDDLAAWPKVTEYVLSEFHRLGLHAPDVGDVFERASQLLRGEIDLVGEGHNLESAYEALSACEGVRIPRVYPGCSAAALVMERMDGVKVSDASPRGSAAASALGRRIVDGLLCRPMSAVGRTALFHGDPHAGNLMRGPQGELIILDWSLTSRLSPFQLEQMAQVMLGLMTFNASRVASAILKLAEGPGSEEKICECVHRSFSEVAAGGLPGLTTVRSLLDDVVIRAGLKLPSEMLILRKSLGLLEGVLHDICSEGALDDEMSRAAIATLMSESWRRWFSHPDDRNFASHLSNADLWTAWMTLPLQFSRRWFCLWT